jgi:hypothetical protein
MNFIKYVLFYLFIPIHVFANCPIEPLSSQNLTEEGIRNYVNRASQVQMNLEDFVCCLPPVFHRSYVLAHSSIAAQDSIPQSPRAILTNLDFNRDSITQLPTAYFSINGGHSSLRQTQVIEMALTDLPTGQNKFFAIDFKTGKPLMGPANPRMCTGCHGNSETGPHLIFDGPRFWPRFVAGLDLLPSLEGHPTAPWFRRYIERLESESLKDLKSNSRFKCLSQNVPGASFQNVLDFSIQELNQKKVLPEILKSSDYHKIKYAIFGSQLCPDQLVQLDCQLVQSQRLRTGQMQNASCAEWIHPDFLKNMQQVGSIFPKIRDLLSLEQMDQVALEAFYLRKTEMQNYIQRSQSQTLIERMPFEFRPGFLDEKQHLLLPGLQGLRSPILRKYALDHALRGAQSPLLTRFLFESRGVPITNWSTDIVGGYQRSGVSAQMLLNLEPGLKSQRQVSCESLRQLSWQATSSSARPY